MTLAELIQEVYTLTARPDLVSETSSAVKAATLKAHQSDYYFKDLFESGIAFSTAAFIQNLDYRALIANWRSLKYLRKFDFTNNVPGRLLETIVPENVLNDYQTQRTDICYGAGAFIQINSSTKEQYYLLGAYLNPILTDAGYSSWVALDHPYFIVFDAAATVFKAIGKDDEATTYRQLVAEQLTMLKTANILVNGF